MEENKKNKVPNVPNLRFKYSDNWQNVKLGNSCLFLKGKVISKNDLSENGKACILYGQLYTTYLSGIISNPISKTDNKNLDLVLSKENDVILPASGETPEDISTCACVLQSGIILGGDINIIRPLSDLSGRFLAFQLLGKRKLDIAKLAVGKSIVHIRNDQLAKLIISFPSYDEQEKIANLICLLNAKIETQNKIIEKLESLRIGIKERIYLLGKTKEPLERILHEVSEKSTVQNQYPVLSSTVKGLFLQSEYFDRAIASENNIGYKIVHKGQIIISPQNLWMGNLTFNDKYESGIVSPSYKIYEIDSKYSKKYIYWLLTSKRSFFNYGLVSEQGASIVRRNLNIDAFMELCLPIIKDKDDESKIEKLIDLIEKKLESEKKRGALLNQQKQFLLSNLFI